MEMERALPITIAVVVVDDDYGVPPPPPSGQHRRHQLQDEEGDEEAELSDQERGGEGEDEDEDEDEDELDDAARYLPDRRQPDYDHPTTHGRRLIDEQIHRSMEVGVLMIQSLEFDFYTALARVLEETNGGGFGGGGPASAAAVAALEKQAFHANAIEECGGAAGVTECAICLMEFDDGEEVSVMPCSRGHQFHTDCIAKWLGCSNSCPLCRRALPAAVDGQ